VITRDAVDELKLKRGDEALAVVKSTEVMIARPVASQPLPKRTRRR
jgi:molybdopterin-binding protein